MPPRPKPTTPEPTSSNAIFKLECALKLQELYFNDATLLVLESGFHDLEACTHAIDCAVKMDDLRHELVRLRVAQKDW